jgi:carbon-monoxide dehydrogenase large subunit
MGQFGIGQPVRRTEDARFVTGRGRYTDDVNLPGQAAAYVLRSPHAHAKILRVDANAAKAAPGVRLVLTGADVKGKIQPVPCIIPMKNRDGSLRADPPHPVLADERVRHVGDPVAFVVAETLAEARDAAELIEIDYETLPAIADTEAAAQPGAIKVYDAMASNVCFDWEKGDRAGVEAAFNAAAHVVSAKVINNRIVVATMEPRMALAGLEPDGRLVFYVSSQNAFNIKAQLCGMLGLKPKELHAITPDVGGGFGMKLFMYAEYALALYAAKTLGRAVKWRAERGEAFLSDTQGRDNVTVGELALDKDLRFLALRVRNIANMGAYFSTFAPYIPTDAGTPLLASVYTFKAIHTEVRGVFTNTVPVDAYRGAGRPEANYLVERLIDKAARELKVSPAELRRRNFIPPNAFPYKTVMGHTYDSGEFARNLDDALKLADADGFEARRADAKKRGKLRGLGLTYYVEGTGGGPTENAAVRFEPDGGVTVWVGTQTNGQGHETAFAQILSDKLGIPFDKIRVTQGDTDMLTVGGGTGGSRSLIMAGGAVLDVSNKIVERGKRFAARALEAAEADIAFADGVFRIAGTDRRIDILALAAKARDARFVPEGEKPGLDTAATFAVQTVHTFPNGAHVCEVEIDQETGATEVVKFVAVDDFGKVVNPLLVEGQVHGGIGQGLGQALLENAHFDPESAQMIAGSFMDYALPRADDFPSFVVGRNEVPCRTNPLGVKGCGEAGAVGAPQTAIIAIIDALRPLGIESIDMPATPLKVWQAIRAAKGS